MAERLIGQITKRTKVKGPIIKAERLKKVERLDYIEVERLDYTKIEKLDYTEAKQLDDAEAKGLNKVETMIQKPSNSRMWNPSDSLIWKKKIKIESLNDIRPKRRGQKRYTKRK